MARFSVNDMDSLMLDLGEIAQLPEDVAEAMLLAEAEVVEEVQKRMGMLMGVHRTGVTLASIGHGEMKVKWDGRVMYVTPQGTNSKGARNAEVAFINEFGAPQRGIAARPFISTANEKAADTAVEAAAKIYEAFLKSNKL